MNPSETPHPHWHALLAGLIPVVLLLPFANKAWHIDDTVYLRVAEQIQQHPLDFYGFQMNWQREPQWVYEFNQNPPGISYYIALVATIFGFHEIPLHISFLLPTFLTGLGAYRLAANFTDRPLAASLTGTLAPAFLVSNSDLMCEPFVAASYTWALALWIEGTDSAKSRKLAAAAAIAGIGILCKYIVITALPLMAAYTLLAKGSRKLALAYLAIPGAILLAYDAYAHSRYGVSLLFGAAGFAADHGASATDLLTRTAINLSFLGGGYISAFFILLTSARPRGLALFAALAAATVIAIVAVGGLDNAYRMYSGSSIRWGYLSHLALFIATGLLILGLTLKQAAARDAKSITLLLWIAGIFAFSGFVNWTINARALLPAAPAIGIVLARSFTDREGNKFRGGSFASSLRLTALISLVALAGDLHYANSQREAARQSIQAVDTLIADGRIPAARQKRWFQGHWGFQYYMENARYTHVSLAGIDIESPGDSTLADIGFQPGDLCIVKGDDRMVNLTRDDSEVIFTVRIEPNFLSRAGTMSPELGAGFYDMRYGELPYCIGYAPPVEYTAYRVLRTGPD